jgi:recombination protein RecA
VLHLILQFTEENSIEIWSIFHLTNTIIEKSGAWYSYGDIKLGQGRENAKQYLKEHKELADELEKKIRENFNLAFNKIKSSSDEDITEN